MKKIIIILGIVLCLIFSASAYTTNIISAPSSYSTSATTSVNISGMINISNNAFPYIDNFVRVSIAGQLNGTFFNVSRHVINFTILNKSSSTGAYGYLASFSVNVTNDTASPVNFWNYTATLNEGRTG